MRNRSYFVFLFLVSITVASCKKEAGIGGKKTISGTVHYLNGATNAMDVASGATVMITYGTKTASSNSDQTVVADADGKYHFDGLNKGDYFITAQYTDGNGFTYTTAGYGITAEKKKDALTVDIDLR